MPDTLLVKQIMFETMPRSNIGHPEYSMGMIEASHDFSSEKKIEERGMGKMKIWGEHPLYNPPDRNKINIREICLVET